MKKFNVILTAYALMIVVGACTKLQTIPVPEVDVLFQLEVSGNEVAFTNQTEGIQNVHWDFGDGQTSTEQNPTHQYPGKGKYVTTLTVTAPSGKAYEGSTVINIAKSSPVRIGDGTLSDWDAVTQHVIEPGASGGVVNTVKLDYDGNYVYVYMDLDSRPQAGDIFDFYMDTDNNAGTGLLTGTFTEGGYDVLLEGPLLAGALDVFYHQGAQADFNFAQQTISDYFTVGAVETAGNNTKFEMRIERGKLRFLTGSGLRIGIVVTKSDWSAELGRAPGTGQASYFLPMDE